MARVFQVGVGSGGIAVLDLVARDPRVAHIVLVDPDFYLPHNVERHLFPISAVGRRKVELAENWLRELRPDLRIDVVAGNLLDPPLQSKFESLAAEADIGICAVDGEPAKHHFDALMRKLAKPWTLGEVLSGGIGGFVHWFAPGGPCYGCVAGHLQRSIDVDKTPAPDYSNPTAAAVEVRIPASKASIAVIASLHALVTLGLLSESTRYDPGFSSMLFALQPVPGIFSESFRCHRLRIGRSPTCLICQPPALDVPPEKLDVALSEALARLDLQ